MHEEVKTTKSFNRFLKRYLSELISKEEFWYNAIIRALWIDNGKGGCCDCKTELIKAKAKIKVVEYILAQHSKHPS